MKAFKHLHFNFTLKVINNHYVLSGDPVDTSDQVGYLATKL